MDENTYRDLTQVTYDPIANAAYVQFGELTDDMKPLRTRQVFVQRGRFELLIDLTSDGALIGIEILGANEALTARAHSVE